MVGIEDIAQALVIRPGDTLILRVADRAQLSEEDAERVRDLAKAQLPGLADVIVIGGVAELAVYREG